MEQLIKVSRISYGIMMAALAIQQIFYKAFRPVILPPWQLSFPGHTIVVYFFSILLIVAAGAIILNIRAKTISFILGGVLLLLVIVCQIPYEILQDPYYGHLGVWAQAMKELVFSGGAFVVAGSLPVAVQNNKTENTLTRLLEKLIPFGSVFVCITMISFGIDHFLYTDGISSLVPNWIPWHIFWTDFAGAALIASGIAIILKIQIKLSALLLALMIFLWLIFLHIPRAIADPYSLQGNEVSSVFEALGFSGIANLIAYGIIKNTALTPVFLEAECPAF